jgi:hypothetical protein
MYSVLLLALGILNLGVALWLFRHWQQGRSAIVLFVLLAMAASPWEVLVAGLGRFIGTGETLRDLAGLPVLWWTLTLPLALFSLATLCRRLGFRWALIDWGHGLVCIGAVLLLLWELPRVFGTKQVFAGCWQDVVYYAPVLPPGQVCPGTPPPGPSPAATWLAPWIVFGAFAAAGIGLAVTRRWPWLALGGIAGCALLALPPAAAGPIPALLGRSLVFWAMAAATVRYAGAASVAGTVAGTNARDAGLSDSNPT